MMLTVLSVDECDTSEVKERLKSCPGYLTHLIPELQISFQAAANIATYEFGGADATPEYEGYAAIYDAFGSEPFSFEGETGINSVVLGAHIYLISLLQTGIADTREAILERWAQGSKELHPSNFGGSLSAWLSFFVSDVVAGLFACAAQSTDAQALPCEAPL